MGESMKLEDQVCSLELAKRLKELGVKQNSQWYWWEKDNGSKEFVHKKEVLVELRYPKEYSLYSAFTVAELGELLPNKITLKFDDMQYECQLFYLNTENGSYCSYRADMDYEPDMEIEACPGNTEANARAKMLIWLFENEK